MNSGAWIDVHNGAYLLTLLISRRSISIQNSCMFVTTSQINTMRHVKANAHNIVRHHAECTNQLGLRKWVGEKRAETIQKNNHLRRTQA